jgi:hypothetical protein
MSLPNPPQPAEIEKHGVATGVQDQSLASRLAAARRSLGGNVGAASGSIASGRAPVVSLRKLPDAKPRRSFTLESIVEAFANHSRVRAFVLARPRLLGLAVRCHNAILRGLRRS